MAVLIGAAFTALIQSSSASTGLIIAMTLQDILILPAAIALILGTNVGTCITALIASVGTTLSAKRAAIAHLTFNVCGVIVAMILFRPFVGFVADTATTVTRQAANAHTIFNIARDRKSVV